MQLSQPPQTSPTAQYNVWDLNPVPIFLALPMRSVPSLKCRPRLASGCPSSLPSCVANCVRRFFFFFEQKLRGVHCSGAPLLNGNGERERERERGGREDGGAARPPSPSLSNCAARSMWPSLRCCETAITAPRGRSPARLPRVPPSPPKHISQRPFQLPSSISNRPRGDQIESVLSLKL